MTVPLVEYRDDGPMATSVRRVGTIGVGSLTLTGLGVLAGAAGLLLDGPATGPASYAGIGLFVVLAALGGAARRDVRVQWLVPPLLRLGEYMTVAVLARRVDGTTTAVAFVLLGVVAFHHYDIVYRLRHQHTAPSHVVSQLCGGWEVRTIVVVLAAATGALLPTLAAMAAWCGVLCVTESVRSWVALALDGTAVAQVGTELEEDAG